MQSNMQREQASRQPQAGPARGTPGHSEPEARLRDMDTDGVEAEVLYCEVSAYRFLYKPEGRMEGNHALPPTTRCSISRPSTRSGSSPSA